MDVFGFVCFLLRLPLTHLYCWFKNQQPLSASKRPFCLVSFSSSTHWLIHDLLEEPWSCPVLSLITTNCMSEPVCVVWSLFCCVWFSEIHTGLLLTLLKRKRWCAHTAAPFRCGILNIGGFVKPLKWPLCVIQTCSLRPYDFSSSASMRLTEWNVSVTIEWIALKLVQAVMLRWGWIVIILAIPRPFLLCHHQVRIIVF